MKVKAACFVDYYSIEELDAISQMEDLPKPFFYIGEGSNILFMKDFPGTILHSRIRFLESFQSDNGMSVRVGAGMKWDDFCEWCALRGLWGPENLSKIPGETGAAAVQNIGAYGREICDILSTIECYDMVEHKMVLFKKSECNYGYRESFFKNEGKGRYVVTAVSFNLKQDYNPVIEYGNVKQTLIDNCGRFIVHENRLTPSHVRKAVIDIRNNKLPDPANVGNAGSFFRNPYISKSQLDDIINAGYADIPHYECSDDMFKIPAAWLIDKCGWKGYVDNNVGVWEKQALIIINKTGKASPSEIKDLEDRIVNSVKEKFGIELIAEVEHV